MTYKQKPSCILRNILHIVITGMYSQTEQKQTKRGSHWNTGLRSPRRSRLRPGWGEALGGRKQCSQVSEIGDGDLLPQAPCTGGQIAGFVVHTQGLQLSQTSCKCTRNQCARKANCVFPGGLPPAESLGMGTREYLAQITWKTISFPKPPTINF